MNFEKFANKITTNENNLKYILLIIYYLNFKIFIDLDYLSLEKIIDMLLKKESYIVSTKNAIKNSNYAKKEKNNDYTTFPLVAIFDKQTVANINTSKKKNPKKENLES